MDIVDELDQWCGVAPSTFVKARDELIRLRAENERLRAALQGIVSRSTNHVDAIARGNKALADEQSAP